MKHAMTASALATLAACSALAGNNPSVPGNLAQAYIDAAPGLGSSSPAALTDDLGTGTSGVKFPAGIRWTASDATKLKAPVTSSVRLPGPSPRTPDAGAFRQPNDFSNLLSGVMPPNTPVPVGGGSGSGAGNSPVTVPLPTGVTMGLVGILTVAAAARRRAARCKSL